MRKLVLFGLLAGVFGLALLLEQIFSRAGESPALAADRAILVLGGGEPREIPETPPAAAREPERRERASQPGRNRGRDGRGERDLEQAPDDAAAAPIVIEDGPRWHVVKRHETLTAIAERELGTTARWKDLARWNGIDDPTALREGARLRLSPPAGDGGAAAKPEKPTAKSKTLRTHVLEQGETLSRVAARFLGDSSRWREIQTLNRIADPAQIRAGTILDLPER